MNKKNVRKGIIVLLCISAIYSIYCLCTKEISLRNFNALPGIYFGYLFSPMFYFSIGYLIIDILVIQSRFGEMNNKKRKIIQFFMFLPIFIYFYSLLKIYLNFTEYIPVIFLSYGILFSLVIKRN